MKKKEKKEIKEEVEEVEVKPLNEYARLASVIGGYGFESFYDTLIISFLAPPLGKGKQTAYVISRVALPLKEAEKFADRLKKAIDKIKKKAEQKEQEV